MPLKFDESQIVNVYGHITSGEVGATNPLSPKLGPCGLALKKKREDIAKETMEKEKCLLVTVKLKDHKLQAKVTVVLSVATFVAKKLKEPDRDSKKVKNKKHNKNISIFLVCKSRVNFLSPLNLLTTFLNVIVWSLCSAISARSGHIGTSRVVIHSPLKLSRDRPEDPFPFYGHLKLCLKVIGIVSWLQMAFYNYSLPKRKFSKFGLPTYSGLQVDERVLSSFSSSWERSFPPPSSDTERTFPSSSYSSTEETSWIQPQILPPLVVTLSGIETRFLSNSTKLEPTFQPDSILSVMLNLSDEIHIDFIEILQVFQDLEKCFIFICVFAIILVLIVEFVSIRVFGLISSLCMLKV